VLIHPYRTIFFATGGTIEINAPVDGCRNCQAALYINAPVNGEVFIILAGQIFVNSEV